MLRPILGMTAMLLLLPASADAYWFRSLYAPRTTAAYYYYPPTVVYYVPVAPLVAYPCPPPAVPAVGVQVPPAAPPLATPTPAPPSVPPAAAPAPAVPPPVTPEVGERRFYDAYAASGRGTAGERVSVSFWNLSGQDVVIVAGGQRFVLPRGRSTTVDASRQFTWQVEGRPAFAEQVPAGESALEIVIRR